MGLVPLCSALGRVIAAVGFHSNGKNVGHISLIKLPWLRVVSVMIYPHSNFSYITSACGFLSSMCFKPCA